MEDGLVPGQGERSAGRLLVVEDHDLVRRLTVTMLEKADFEVLAAASGVEALRLLKAQDRHIDCALIDLTMPGLSGRELAEAIHETRPEQAIILMSAYSEQMAADVSPGRFRPKYFLQKPFTAEALVEAIRRALGDQQAQPS